MLHMFKNNIYNCFNPACKYVLIPSYLKFESFNRTRVSQNQNCFTVETGKRQHLKFSLSIGCFSIYFTHLKLPILKLILNSHNTIFRLCKSLKATCTFSHKENKLAWLTANKTENQAMFLVEAVMQKTKKTNGCQYCVANTIRAKETNKTW